MHAPMASRASVACFLGFLGAGCGGGGAGPTVVPVVPGAATAGIGDCVDPSLATAVAHADRLPDGRIEVCRDDGEACRAIDPASGAMSERFPTIEGQLYDQPAVAVEDDGQLLVCWGGPGSCLRRTPTAYERWMTGQVDSGRVAVLSSEHDRRWITIMDGQLTTTARFEVAPGAVELVWTDGRFLVRAAEDGVLHGYLYDAGGRARGVVGALASGRAFDVTGVAPVAVRPGVWAFIDRDASAVASHEVDGGDGVRVETGVSDQPPGTAGLAATASGALVVALGGTRYGDLVVVDVDARVVRQVPAHHCDGGP